MSLAIVTSGTLWPFAFGVLAPVLLEEFALTPGAFGVVYAIYYLSAVVTSPWIGRAIDRVPFRRSVRIMAAVTVVQLMLFATATSFVGLVASAVVGGLVMTSANPFTNLFITSALGGRGVRVAVGIKMGGVPLAAMATGAILPAIADASDWRMAVAACMALPLLVVVTSIRMIGGGPMVATAGGAVTPAGPRAGLPVRTGLELYALMLGMVTAGANAYLPLFTVTELSGSLARGGALLSAFALAAALGRFFWSVVGRRSYVLLILTALPAIGGAALLGVSVIRTEALLWPMVILCGLTVMAWQGVGMLAIIDVAPGSVARTSARVFQWYYAGFVVGAPLIGFLVERFSYLMGWATLAAAATTAAASLAPRARAEASQRRLDAREP